MTPPPPAPRRARWWRLSLRLRLTILTVFVFTLIHSLISLGRFYYVEQQLDVALTEKLEQQAMSLRDKLASTAVPPSSESFESLVDAEPRSILVEEPLVSLFTAAGKLVATNCRPEVSFLLAGGDEAVNTGRHVQRRFAVAALQTQDNARRAGRTVAVRFDDSAGRTLVLVVATSDEFVTQLTATLRTNILLAILIGVAASLASGWLISGIAVRPLRRLQEIAQMLRPDSLTARIDIGSTATDVARLQERLNEARDRLDAGYRAQEQFAGNVAHELKTPLAIIVAQAELLRVDPKLPPQVKQFVDTTRDEALRLARLCDSFLLLGRVRHGKPVQPTSRPILVNDWIMDCVQDCTGVAERFGVKLAPTLLMDEDDLDAKVMGDPGLLAILLDNLIRNGCRFSPPGRDVGIRASVDDTGGRVRVVVRDHGPGIPPAMLRQIFERFVQVEEDPGTAGRKGSGIGLQIALGIAQLHAGTITAVNRPDGGCAFTVNLPLAKPPAPAPSVVTGDGQP
jgi:signal transduction histidine kinase